MGRIEEEFAEYAGREMPLVIEPYRLDDAEIAVVAMGAIASEARVAVESLRNKGIRAGLLRVKAFRPFPAKEIRKELEGKEVFVFDRSLSPGAGGILHGEIKAAFSDAGLNLRIVGLGGVDVTKRTIEKAIFGKDVWIKEVVA
jgi:pyruvate/2-oxoacid:ferredoxin oxidoreductase alpha subunit